MLIMGDKTLGHSVQSEAVGFRLGGHRFAVVRVTGESHQKKREACDDFWAVATEGAATAFVIADGAGSAPLGQEGAQAIASALAESMVRPRLALLVTAGETAVEELKHTIVMETERVRLRLAQAHPYRDTTAALKLYAATVIGFVAVDNHVISFQVGDGFGACVADKQLESGQSFARYVSPPDNGTYANETFFFTQDKWSERLRIGGTSGARYIVGMTDGVTAFACTKGYSDLEPAFWSPVLKYFDEKTEMETARALVAQLQSPAVMDLSDDDKTIIVMQRLDR
jgi:hypothetical protein